MSLDLKFVNTFMSMNTKYLLRLIYEVLMETDGSNLGYVPQNGNPKLHKFYDFVGVFAMKHKICCMCERPNVDESRDLHDDEYSCDVRPKNSPLCAKCCENNYT